MHTFEEAPAKAEDVDDGRPWYKLLNRYHWFVLVVAALGWLFDTMDQQLFMLARVDAMRELLTVDKELPTRRDDCRVQRLRHDDLSDWLGDRRHRLRHHGRSHRPGQDDVADDSHLFAVHRPERALAPASGTSHSTDSSPGSGVGGEFAVGVSLVAEVMPSRARPLALGLLQALSAVGNVTAALISMFLGRLESGDAFAELVVGGTPIKAWRIMFVIGILPSLLAILIRRRLKEPERWQSSVQTGEVARKAGSYAALFGDPRWRKRAIVGLVLASAGVIGLWGIGFFTPDLLDSVLRKSYVGKGLSDAEINGNVTFWKGISSLMVNIGAFFGIYAFAMVTHHTGRRVAFAISFVLAMLSTIMVFSTDAG